MKSSKLWIIKWILRQMLKINLVVWFTTKNVCLCFYVQNCRTQRSSNWYQVLVFEFSNFNNLWKHSFCNIISEKGSAESGLIDSHETHAARFCSATLSYFLVGGVRLWSDTINMCSKKPVFELFYIPVAILVHRDCSGWQDHWNTVHGSHHLFLPHLLWRVHWVKWGQKADDTEPTASLYTARGGVASREGSVVDSSGQFKFFICCWAYKVQLR